MLKWSLRNQAPVIFVAFEILGFGIWNYLRPSQWLPASVCQSTCSSEWSFGMKFLILYNIYRMLWQIHLLFCQRCNSWIYSTKSINVVDQMLVTSLSILYGYSNVANMANWLILFFYNFHLHYMAIWYRLWLQITITPCLVSKMSHRRNLLPSSKLLD